MKWHKFPSNFWDSEIAECVHEEFGDKGLIIYLRIISHISNSVQSSKDVEHIHDFGVAKSMESWRRICRAGPQFVHDFFTFCHKNDFILLSINPQNRYLLFFPNIGEFVHRDALSSTKRHFNKSNSGRPELGQLAPQDKIREKNELSTRMSIQIGMPKETSFADKKRRAQALAQLALKKYEAPIALAPYGPDEGFNEE